MFTQSRIAIAAAFLTMFAAPAFAGQPKDAMASDAIKSDAMAGDAMTGHKMTAADKKKLAACKKMAPARAAKNAACAKLMKAPMDAM